MTTKPAKHWASYVTQIGWALLVVVLLERAYPTPWIQSPFGRVAWAFITFYILKGFHEYKQIKSASYYAKTQRRAAYLKSKTFNLSPYTRHRLVQVWRVILISMALGYVIDMSTPACEGVINCAVSIPNLIATNLADLLWFMIRLAMGFAGFIGVQEIAARQGLMDVTLPHSIKTRFSDVYGQDAAVASVREALKILKKPGEVEALGGYMPTGIMMYGPPGVGKSYIAEAMAGEAEKPFISIDGSSFTSMWAGVPQRRVKLIFKKLRAFSVKYGGVVVFFDEIDVLGSRGGGVLQQLVSKLYNRNASEEDRIQLSSGSGALQQILTEMSGVAKSRGFYNKLRLWFGFEMLPPAILRILWTAATNLPGALDGALTRPGRFDRKLHLGYPNLSGRVETINGYLNKIHAHNLTDKQILTLARENPQATGASIKAMVNEGLLSAVRDGRTTVTFEDMRDYLLKAMMGESTGRMELPEDRWRTATHEGAHAVMSHHFRPEAPIQFVSVEKRGSTGGFVKSVDDVDRFRVASCLFSVLTLAPIVRMGLETPNEIYSRGREVSSSA
jgi:ATP-dependent Zn protease